MSSVLCIRGNISSLVTLVTTAHAVAAAGMFALRSFCESDVALCVGMLDLEPGWADAAAALLVRAGGIRANGCMRCRATCRRLGVRTAATRRVHERASDRVRAPLIERERAEQKEAERRGEEKRRESRAQESTRIGSRCSVPGDEVRDIAAPHSLCLCKCPCLPVYSSHSHRHLVGPCLAYIGGAQSSLHLCRGATAPGRVASWRHSVLVTVDVGWGGPRPTRRGPGTGVRHEPPPRLSWSSMLSAVYSRRIPQETSGPHKPVAAQAYPSTSLPQHKPAPAQACRSTSLPQHKPAAA
jgi:hypothetical protein